MCLCVCDAFSEHHKMATIRIPLQEGDDDKIVTFQANQVDGFAHNLVKSRWGRQILADPSFAERGP